MQAFFAQVCGIDISQGAIQNCLNRASEAVRPHRDAVARESGGGCRPRGRDNEPSLRACGRKKHWLWALVSSTLCFYMILDSRSAGAFIQLVGDWAGILVSDGFAVYLKWAGEARQSCLAHLLRKAKKLEEDPVPEIVRGGRWILAGLRRLNKMADNPPTSGEYMDWKGRFSWWGRKYEAFGGELGACARHLWREVDCIVTFLDYEGVDPANNRCERAVRSHVCRRKTSFGCASAHGEVDIARFLTLHETCRLNGRSTYEELKKALEHRARGRPPSLYWIRKAGMKSGTKSPEELRAQPAGTVN
ncbi:MAG: transposase [Desulfovibrio sp.]|nr:transposase [Desulfovibrio sp.]